MRNKATEERINVGRKQRMGVWRMKRLGNVERLGTQGRWVGGKWNRKNKKTGNGSFQPAGSPSVDRARRRPRVTGKGGAQNDNGGKRRVQ